MNIQSTKEALETPTPIVAEYEAPAIESVLTPESLEREVLYAGNIAVSTPPTN